MPTVQPLSTKKIKTVSKKQINLGATGGPKGMARTKKVIQDRTSITPISVYKTTISPVLAASKTFDNPKIEEINMSL